MSSLTLTIEDELVARIAAVVLERVNEPRWLDVEGLSTHYGVSVRQIRGWRESGMPARRVGKRLMADVREVNAWLDERPWA